MHKNRNAKSYYLFEVLNSSDAGSIYRVNMYLDIINPKKGNESDTSMDAIIPKYISLLGLYIDIISAVDIFL